MLMLISPFSPGRSSLGFTHLPLKEEMATVRLSSFRTGDKGVFDKLDTKDVFKHPDGDIVPQPPKKAQKKQMARRGGLSFMPYLFFDLVMGSIAIGRILGHFTTAQPSCLRHCNLKGEGFFAGSFVRPITKRLGLAKPATAPEIFFFRG
jgi:hypothetical protein